MLLDKEMCDPSNYLQTALSQPQMMVVSDLDGKLSTIIKDTMNYYI